MSQQIGSCLIQHEGHKHFPLCLKYISVISSYFIGNIYIRGNICWLQERMVEVDYSKLWSREARRRLMPGLRDLSTKFNGIPGLIPLHGGLPPVSAFPLTGIHLTLNDGTKVDISGDDEVSSKPAFSLKFMIIVVW